jgi:pimeloyl-ACP methyl ester carboxylesterase
VPELGRFISRDPIGYRGALQPYSYVSNRPASAIDPLGLFKLVDAHSSTRYGRNKWGRYTSFLSNSNYTIVGGWGKCPPCALIWVHGYANTFLNALKNFQIAEDGYTNANQKGCCEVYGFYWNSKPAAQYFGAATIGARQVGSGAFAQFIRDFKSRCPKTRLSIFSHSLGAAVVLSGLLEEGVSADLVVLVQAAVDNASIQSGEEFGDAPSSATEMWVTYDDEDDTLGSWYVGSRVDSALGSAGPQDRSKVADNVHCHNMEESWGDDHSGVNKRNKNSGFWSEYEPLIR